jgi:hypothetical protein
MTSHKSVKPRFHRGFSTIELILVLLIGFILFTALFTKLGQKPNLTLTTNQQQIQPNTSKFPPGIVFFINADVMLVPGDDWQRLKTGPFTDAQSICMPVLMGTGTNSGNLIQVFTTPANSDAQTAADILKSKVESDPNTIKGTFKQFDFIADDGIHGIHVSYDYKSLDMSRINKLKAHVYLFQNKKNNFITINYITFVDKDSAGVDAMIHHTLMLH